LQERSRMDRRQEQEAGAGGKEQEAGGRRDASK